MRFGAGESWMAAGGNALENFLFRTDDVARLDGDELRDMREVRAGVQREIEFAGQRARQLTTCRKRRSAGAGTEEWRALAGSNAFSQFLPVFRLQHCGRSNGFA